MTATNTWALLLLTVGLLIGPRGNTLKKMETESGAKIAIRGKGSVKEGKGRSDAAHTSNQEEDLHCLIMADTEDKVNKAKQLIHNVIETVSRRPIFPREEDVQLLIGDRPLRSPKVKTNSSATNSVSLLRSTVPCETTKTRLVKTADRLGTANTIAPSNATLRPTSSVASAETQDTWQETVPRDNGDKTGATMEELLDVPLPGASSPAMRISTTSWKSWVVQGPSALERLKHASKRVRVAILVHPSHGSEAPQEHQRHGINLTPSARAHLAVLRHGQEVVVAAAAVVVGAAVLTTIRTVVVMASNRRVDTAEAAAADQHRGSKVTKVTKATKASSSTVTAVAMAVTAVTAVLLEDTSRVVMEVRLAWAGQLHGNRTTERHLLPLRHHQATRLPR